MALETYLRERQKARDDILIMTHIVVGYPSFTASRQLVQAMVDGGVDLIELQIPFSEPIADGPVIAQANQAALAQGATVERCLEFAGEMSRAHAIPFLCMTYYNLVVRRGVDRFVERWREAGVSGAIVPDLPPEEADEYLAAMRAAQLDSVFIFSPNSSEARLRLIAGCARGFVYCVARPGVTGAQTDFTAELLGYLARCRAATSLPLALGFGVKHRADVDFLRGKVEMAVLGSETLRVLDAQGVEAVGPFVRGLRG
ncbi:tryptophan synthase subunit alpha [Myxococcota bacterium]